MKLDYARIATVSTPEISRIFAAGSQLARAGRLEYYPPEHLFTAVLSASTPVIQAVKEEFMISAESVWARLRKHFAAPDILSMCSKPPMTPHLKQIMSEVVEAAISEQRRIRPFDLLVALVHHPTPILSQALREFDLTPEELGPFISAHEHLEPPKAIGPIQAPMKYDPRQYIVRSPAPHNWPLGAYKQTNRSANGPVKQPAPKKPG